MGEAAKACETCGGRGFVLFEENGSRQARECSCRREHRREGLFAAAGVPARYRNCSFEDFNSLNRASLKSARRVAQEFCEAYPYLENDAGLLFMGPSGVGKTHLAIAIVNAITKSKGRAGLYVNFSDIILKIQSTFRPEASDSKEDVLELYADAELLVLDDVGATRPTEFVRDMLYALLNTRYNNRRVTICTTNYLDEPPKGEREKLEDRVGYRLRSRLHEMCRTVIMEGDDYRSKVQQAGLRPVKKS